jgi:IS605 OrfB family transposase
VRTYHARVGLDAEASAALKDYATLFGRALRTLHAHRRRGRELTKPEFMRRFDLTSRQYNALKFTLDGMESSIRELRPGQIVDLQRRIDAVCRKREGESRPEKIHHLTRRVESLRLRLKVLESDADVRLCFGSRKLFNAQHHLEENALGSHAEWRDAWTAKRSSQFFVLGSKDESAGCQGCVLTHLGGDRFVVRLRLNGVLRRVVSFEVRFAHGAEHLVDALRVKQAISYRFLCDEKGWRIFATTKALEIRAQSRLASGCVGVDLNVGFVAVSQTDRFGNLVDAFNVPLPLADTSLHQAKTAIAECVKVVVEHAARVGKPLSVERLDFAKKKAQLSYASAGRQRMLSSFAYRAFERILSARSHDAGVEVCRVSPAYSSKIGRQKYARRYGLSVHLAAALVLARRAQRFRDRYVPSGRGHSASTCKDRCGHVLARVDDTQRSRKSAERSPRGDPRERTAACRQRPRASDQSVQPGGNPGRQSPARRVRPTSRITRFADP